MKSLILCLLALIASVNAWNSETHLLIARMAYDILKKENPTALNKAENLLKVYSDDLTKMHENMYPFVECVTLPDDNKRRGGGWQSNWHFDDQPFIGDKSKESDLHITYNAKNISMAMPSILTWLSGDDATPTVAYQTVMKYVKTEEEGKSLALRLLIHYYGDIHQPLHSSDRYTKEFPDGDKGGNMFLIKNHYSANELHALWDNVIYTYHKNPKRPFTEQTWADFGVLSDDLHTKFSFPQNEIDTLDFAQFRDESFAIAVTVYDGIKMGKEEVVPESYINKFQPIAQQRVALAAYRLVYMIEQVFGNNNTIHKQTAFLN